MDWDDLRFIRALGAAGTLQRAADTLSVHHSTVFRRLGRIETSLGVRLFDRHRDGFTLTAAGEEVVDTAERLGLELDDLERRIAGRDMRPTGLVRLTTTDTLLNGLLGPVIARFRRDYPGITLEITAGNPFVSLSRRDADVALRPTVSPPENLVGRRIVDVATAIYAANDYLSRAPDIRNLNQQDWIAADDSLAHLKSSRWFREQMKDVEPVLRCNNLSGMLAAARAGVGLALLPCFMGDPSPELSRISPPSDDLKVGLWLLTHPDLRRVARIRTLLDHLHDEIGAQRPLLEGDGEQHVPA